MEHEKLKNCFSAKTPFQFLAKLMDKLTTSKGKEKTEHLDRFFNAYGWGDFYPVFRLLLPQHDNDRRVYSMKEKVIAKLYVDALSINPDSDAGKRLLSYKVPSQNQPNAGDFGTAVYLALQDRLARDSSMTIAQLNDHLDRLSLANSKDEQKRILTQMLRDSTAIMQKWIVRIILKDMKVKKGGKRKKKRIYFFFPMICRLDRERKCSCLICTLMRIHYLQFIAT